MSSQTFEFGKNFRNFLKGILNSPKQSVHVDFKLDDNEIQGNIFGFNKPFQVLLKVMFNEDLASSESVLKNISEKLTSIKNVKSYRKKRRSNPELISSEVWANAGFEIDKENPDKFDRKKILIILSSDRKEVLEKELENLKKEFERLPAELKISPMGQRLPGNKEHFGFKDGISQPFVPGLTKKKNLVGYGELPNLPGDYIFGYPSSREEDQTPFFGSLASKNGSLLVYLQLKQNTKEFDEYLTRAVIELKKKYSDLKISKGWLAAKLMGRWKDGTPIEQTESENKYGLGCPFSSHIHKAYPRRKLNTIPITKSRILRRGIPYGDSQDKKAEKGLLFICYQTSLKSQFEFIYGNMLDSDFPLPNSGFDPFGPKNSRLGNTTIFTLPLRNQDGTIVHELLEIPKFVELITGGYFFMPSISYFNSIINTFGEK
ncbi:Dyp-type peroxidase [Flagellimonas sp.]|uniref:Dyp-type peroxidase n=1 Tax=Flagellimonas sp. TaxID=2058762 RepID=UPI003F49E794